MIIEISTYLLLKDIKGGIRKNHAMIRAMIGTPSSSSPRYHFDEVHVQGSWIPPREFLPKKKIKPVHVYLRNKKMAKEKPSGKETKSLEAKPFSKVFEVPAMAAHGLDVEATAKRCMGAL